MSRKFCPVGTLLPGVKVVILNKEHQRQPVGVSGEVRQFEFKECFDEIPARNFHRLFDVSQKYFYETF